MKHIADQFSFDFDYNLNEQISIGSEVGCWSDAESSLPEAEAPLPAAGSPLSTEEIVAAVRSWTDVQLARKRKLISTINTVVRMTEIIPKSQRSNLKANPETGLWCCRALNELLWAREPAVLGLKKRNFENLISDLRFILIRLGLHALSYRGKNTLSPGWSSLISALQSNGQRYGITRFFRYCTLEGLEPADIVPETLEAFERWCVEDILCEDPDGMARRTAFVWNEGRQTVPAWPQIEMVRANRPDHYAIPLDKFPPAFQVDVQAFLKTLAEGPGDICKITKAFTENEKSGSGSSLMRALSPRTVKTREDYLKIAATALVESGIPIDEITSLHDLLTPIDRVHMILRFHLERLRARKIAAGEPSDPENLKSNNLGAIAETLRQVGKFYLDLPTEHIAAIKKLGSRVSEKRQATMTEQNFVRVRALLDPKIYPHLIHLPQTTWMTRANDSILFPQDRALLALYACALEILMFLPLRRKNLVMLSLEKNLRRPRTGELISDIVIPGSQVKNKEPIVWPVPEASARLIEEYIQKYRPLLAEKGNPYLFPGVGINHRNLSEFGTQLNQRIEGELGIKFNTHLARHFAVLRYLNKYPGQYEMVSRLLGHKSVATTIAFYAGAEMEAAAKHINDVLLDERQETAAAAKAFKLRQKRKPKSWKKGLEPSGHEV